MLDGDVVVFGGSGFIGSHLLARLAGETPGCVVSVDIREPAQRIEGVRYVHGDVRGLAGADLPEKISRIYNLAAVHTTPGHPTHEYYETNIAGATEITALARRSGCSSIVFTSSISVYGPGEDAKTEQTPPDPASAYGWSKWLAEGVHRTWRDENPDRQLVICRPAVIFGKGEGGNFTRLATMLRKGFFVYPGRRDTIKACFYVGDLLDAFEQVLSTNERYVLFNGCYPDRYTIEQIVGAFRHAHFRSAKTVTLPHAALMAAATLLRPFSAAGLGIHPERITKLVRSTDIVPHWLESRGWATSDRLSHALSHWDQDSGGRFV